SAHARPRLRAVRPRYLFARRGRAVRAAATAAATSGGTDAAASRPIAGLHRGLPDTRQTLLARQSALAYRCGYLQRERLRKPRDRTARHERHRAELSARRAVEGLQLEGLQRLNSRTAAPRSAAACPRTRAGADG